MRRDMDLVRAILLRGEEAGYHELSANAFGQEGYDTRVVAAHMRLMHEARLVEANLFTLESEGAIEGHIERLTWAGHDYLDAIRNKGVWARTKKLVVDKVGSAPLEVFKAVAVKVRLDRLGLGGTE